MKKNVSQHVTHSLSRFTRSGLLVASSIFLVVATLIPSWRHMVWADDYQAQINALTEQNAANRSALSELESVAQSYADAIQKLQQQIDGLQASINSNMDLQAQLQKQIAEAQAEIDRQRAILAEDVKAMYVDGTPSSLEMLASSRDFSDYVSRKRS